MALSAAIAEKLKPDIEKNCGYYRMPQSICRDRRLTPAHTIHAGLIYSYSNPRKGTADCTRTHRGFSEELRTSPATITRGFERLRNLKDKDGKELEILETIKQSSYRIDKAKINSRCFRLEKYFLNHEFKFNIKNKDGNGVKYMRRRLTPIEALCASYIYSKYDYQHDKKTGVKASYKDIAEVLGCCEKTAGKIINNLMKCSLIFRPKEDKGLNGFKKSVYHPESDLLRLIKEARERSVKARRKAQAHSEEPARSEVQKSAKATHEREKYYSELRHAAEQRAKDNLDIMRNDSEYNKAKAEQVKIIIGHGKYKTLSPEERNVELLKLNATIAQAFRRLGLSESDLEPRYKCSVCNDTGYRKDNGRPCDCFPETHFKDLLD